MDELMVNREAITRPPTHPGVLFKRDILPELGRRTMGEIATFLGVTRQTLHRVLAGDAAISPEMAIRLGRLCGNGPDLWLALQNRYDLWKARRHLGKKIERIPNLRDT
jgi:addiction module HigA family antidote